MEYKLFKVTALMDMGEEAPVIFTFDLPAPDENGVNGALSKMDTIRKVLSVEETEKPISEEYIDDSLEGGTF